jgi:hypothetical protein
MLTGGAKIGNPPAHLPSILGQSNIDYGGRFRLRMLKSRLCRDKIGDVLGNR